MNFLVSFVIFCVGFTFSSPHSPYYKQGGLYGGLGAGSTILYYQYMIDIVEEKYVEKYQYPELIIYSANWIELKNLVYQDPPDWEKVVEIISSKFNEMVTFGADFGAIACNTLHYVFDEIQEKTKMPLLSIVNATLDAMMEVGYKKTLLLGSKSTMTTGYYQKAFKGKIEMHIPNGTDVEYIDDKIFTELMHGIFKNSTRDHFVSIIQKSKDLYGIDSVVIGCTEVSLLLADKQYVGVDMCDSSHLHAKAMLDYARKF